MDAVCREVGLAAACWVLGEGGAPCVVAGSLTVAGRGRWNGSI
jgi:hypothetical protein